MKVFFSSVLFREMIFYLWSQRLPDLWGSLGLLTQEGENSHDLRLSWGLPRPSCKGPQAPRTTQSRVTPAAAEKSAHLRGSVLVLQGYWQIVVDQVSKTIPIYYFMVLRVRSLETVWISSPLGSHEVKFKVSVDLSSFLEALVVQLLPTPLR